MLICSTEENLHLMYKNIERGIHSRSKYENIYLDGHSTSEKHFYIIPVSGRFDYLNQNVHSLKIFISFEFTILYLHIFGYTIRFSLKFLLFRYQKKKTISKIEGRKIIGFSNHEQAKQFCSINMNLLLVFNLRKLQEKNVSS